MPDAATATPTDAAAPVTGVLPADPGAATGTALIEDELSVEEISIDGMCGVY